VSPCVRRRISPQARSPHRYRALCLHPQSALSWELDPHSWRCYRRALLDFRASLALLFRRLLFHRHAQGRARTSLEAFCRFRSICGSRAALSAPSRSCQFRYLRRVRVFGWEILGGVIFVSSIYEKPRVASRGRPPLAAGRPICSVAYRFALSWPLAPNRASQSIEFQACPQLSAPAPFSLCRSYVANKCCGNGHGRRLHAILLNLTSVSR